MKRQDNILQYEFFHVGGKGAGSLEVVMVECLERTVSSLPLAIAGDDTGPGIKTVVRIYDTGNQVTRLAKQVKDLEAQREIYYGTLRNNIISKVYTVWCLWRLDRKVDSLKKLMVSFFTEHLYASFKGEWSVARETWEHAFRPARRDEYIELHQASIMAKNLWLFIFEPNDLLADRNQIIVSVI